MQRRKFVIGMGALAAGSAAAVGSGAFNVVRADREISVEIADDSEAYLGLNSESAYAEERDGQLELAFDGSIEGQNGEGLNENANMVFTDVFSIKNNGTDDVNIQLSDSLDSVSWDTRFPRAYYSDDSLGTTNDVNGDGDFLEGDIAEIEVGEQIYIHLEFVGREVAQEAEDDDDVNFDVPETIGIYGEATS